MNGELIWVLSLLAVAIVLFATGRVRMDAVALFVIVAFAISGTQTVPEVFSGFSHPNVVLIAAVKFCRADKRHDDAGGDAAEPGSQQ